MNLITHITIHCSGINLKDINAPKKKKKEKKKGEKSNHKKSSNTTGVSVSEGKIDVFLSI